MKFKTLFCLLAICLFVSSCNSKKSEQSTFNSVLKDSIGWKKEILQDGLVYYSYVGYYEPFRSKQRVDVLLVNLDKNTLVFDDNRPSDSLSSKVTHYPGALAAINGTYYEFVKTNEGDTLYSSFFKRDGTIHTSVTIPENDRLFWKHEGAFYYDKQLNEWGIVYGDKDYYDQMPYANALSGSPMLIDDYKLVGKSFVKPRTVPLDSLDYEDKDRHQGIRHPRTALALTDENYLLMITVDGRREQTAGMTAKELTSFINYYFQPRYALNIDGGGSTTMWIKDSKSPNGVVNYPTDNKTFDHFGQRMIRNALIVIEK